MNAFKPLFVLLVTSTVIGGVSHRAAAQQVVQSAREAAEFPQTALACKLRMGPIFQSQDGFDGTRCAATCNVISWLKGDAGQEVEIFFRRDGNGPRISDFSAIKEGDVYLVMLKGTDAPYQVFAAMRAVEDVVKPTLGTKPGDRLMAELLAMCASNDGEMCIDAVKQIGVMRDKRGSKVVAQAAKDGDPDTARAGLIAQYRMKIAPDAKRVMELFDQEVMNAWYEESGQPLLDAQGQHLRRKQGNNSFIERGVPDFDYATYVREGIKNDWVMKDEHTLYVFFGIPWKVQRKECVPELVKLLEHSDKRVQWWAVTCLAHTVENQHEHPAGEPYKEAAKQELEKWRKWWKEHGKAYMAQ